VVLGALALGFLIVVALYVRNPFGIVYTSLVAIILGWLACTGSAQRSQVALVFLSVQLALSVFSRGDYLFKDSADTSAGTMPSDVAHMASALGGPYWAWGLVCGAFSLIVLSLGVWLFLRALRPRSLAR
jgi:hypothetical protein